MAKGVGRSIDLRYGFIIEVHVAPCIFNAQSIGKEPRETLAEVMG